VEQINIDVLIRNKSTDGLLNFLRKEGYVPGIIYGNSLVNQNIQINKKELNSQLKKHGKSGIFYAIIEDEVVPVKINEIQRDTIVGEIVHVDLQRIDLAKTVHMSIPILLFGNSAGVKSGGTIQQQIRELEVKSIPSLIPESIHINVSDLKIGQAIYIKDLLIPEGVEILHDNNSVVLTILPPKMPEEEIKREEIPKSEPEIVNARDGHGIDAAK